MELLCKKLEKVLKEILEKKTDNNEIDVTSMERELIDELMDRDYLNGGLARLNSNARYVTVTYKGKYYFDNKKEYLKLKFTVSTFEWVRYIVTTLISVLALIISMCK